MTTGTVFTNNRTQAVRLPADMRFPNTVKKVNIRAIGNERVISPAENSWDSFFMADNYAPTEDFMNERADQTQAAREIL